MTKPMGNVIELPVSFGEALDKLSILEIKLEKITDDRRKDVQVEYDLLHNKLKYLFTETSYYHYTILKYINLAIWDMQDVFRDSKNEKEKVRLAMQIIDDNDRRFRVKAKLNALFNSHLKEQKGYARKRAYVGIVPDDGNIDKFYATVRYLSTCFDQVIVHSDNAEMFKDDPTIVVGGGDDGDVRIDFYIDIPEYYYRINNRFFSRSCKDSASTS
jgi:hypothetical protein